MFVFEAVMQTIALKKLQDASRRACTCAMPQDSMEVPDGSCDACRASNLLARMRDGKGSDVAYKAEVQS